VSPADRERFECIERDVQNGYAITFKDLAWLVRMVAKLEKLSAVSQSCQPKLSAKARPEAKPAPLGSGAGGTEVPKRPVRRHRPKARSITK
jgi:hypothetical protein